MSNPDVLGWLAAGLMVATFGCREARAMRPLAVATNLAFIGYGAAASLAPVLTLHLLLLPINLWRWAEVLRTKESFVTLMNLMNRAAPAVALAACVALSACGGGGGAPPPEGPALEPVSIEREWQFTFTRGHQSKPEPGDPPITRSQPGEYHDWQEVGGQIYGPANPAINAHAEIYTSASGMTYYAYAVAPPADNNVDPLTGTATRFEQRQVFRKLAADARLSYVVNQTDLLVTDYNIDPPDESDCPYEVIFKEEPVWGTNAIGRLVVTGTQTLPDYVRTQCSSAITASLRFEIVARHGRRTLGWSEGSLELYGHQDAWGWSFDDGFSGLEESAFNVDLKGGILSGLALYAGVSLKKPVVVPVKLADVPVGELIYVSSSVHTQATNHRHRESSAYAAFRDPGDASGAAFVYEGLEPVAIPPGTAWPAPEDDTPACANADPAAGSITFEHAEYDADELPGLGARITLVRSGGRTGQVSVQFDTADGSARAPGDYQATSRRVRFAEGQTRRTVRVPITLDGQAEFIKSLTLKLSDPRGCAALGAQSQAQLHLHDEDHPLPPPPRFTVGGTVTGLAGGTLVLRDLQQAVDLTVSANGNFVFDRKYRSGNAYEVQVKQAPRAPAQVCTVLDGVGNVAGNVSHIEVRCEAPALPGALDPGFGTLGKVAGGLPGGAIAIARQSTGHILATNGQRLVRYTPDGRLDLGFGNGAGFVDNLLPMTGGEVADLAVLADDRIVVAGRVLQPARSAPYYQMAAARLSAGGVRDSGFGGTGLVTVRLAGVGEQATRVLARPDGRVVLVGQTTVQDDPAVPQFNNNIVLVQLAADGAVDTGFGTAGAVIADALLRDFSFAAALQSDGRIVVAGRTSNTNTDPTDTVFTRISVAGALEPGFGRNVAYSPLDDEAVDAVVQPDGRIVLLVAARGLNAEIALVRLNTDGSPDTSFGVNGLVRTDVGPHDDLPRALALQADGKLLVASQLSRATGSPSFGLLRYRPDGGLDTGFGSGGVLRVDFFGGLDSANDLLVQPDGRIVAAGSARSGLTAEIAMVRLIP